MSTRAEQATEYKMAIPVQFTLQPHGNCQWIESISGMVTRTEQEIHCQYDISGDWRLIRWPKTRTNTARITGLWRSTCCELFIAAQNSRAYTEVNLSPSGDWNCFEFDNYRSGMRPSSKVALKSLTTHSCTPSTKRLLAELECCESLADLPVIELGIATVLAVETLPANQQTSRITPIEDRELYYHSLGRSEGNPDFHIRADFLLKLEKPS
jgi:hypothetical protein